MFRTAFPRCRAAFAGAASTLCAFSAAFLAASSAWAIDPPPYERDWGQMWERGGWDGWQAHAMIFWPVFALLGVVALALIGAAIYHGFHPNGSAARHSPVAGGHRILAERFARGEIDEAEYRDKRRVLGKR